MRWPPGLRGRLLVALLATSAATLIAAAVTLLPPLRQRLREQSTSSLQAAVLSARPQLQAAIRRSGGVGSDATKVAGDLAIRVDGRVIIYTDARGGITKDYDNFTTIDDASDALRALALDRTIRSEEDNITRVATPLHWTDRPYERPAYILAVRKRNTDLTSTVDVVRDAFLKAAVIGLGIALVLGLVVATTLLRRLRRLRAAALRIGEEGGAAPPPSDPGRDEVGDLARTLAAMQTALRRQEEARRRFVATASHELRTPITSASGTLELLAEDLAEGHLDADDARAQVESARIQLERLRNLSAELLDLSRLDAGVALRSEPVELAELSRAVVAEFELRARAAGRRVEVSVPPGPCWAKGDPDAVARIARILIDNALRYAPGPTPVRVDAGYHGAHATLSVSDEGPGVPEGERERIFERFERGTAATEGGFGLGLAIGRELAERLGGRLVLEDPPAGEDDVPHGARFVLVLPIEMPAGSHPLEPVAG